MTTEESEAGPAVERMPLQRQSTFGLYELVEDASDLDYDVVPGSICTTPRVNSSDHNKAITRRQELQSSLQTKSGSSEKKRLTRTDSEVVIVHSPVHGDEKTGTRNKPQPSPPILLHRECGEKRAQRQHTVSGSDAADVNYMQAIKAGTSSGPLGLTNYTSCPNLVEDIGFTGKAKIRQSKSSEGRLCKTAPTTSARTSPSLLTVPDVFTTSYTHNKPINRNIEKVRGRRNQRLSHLDRNISLDSSSSEGSGTGSSSGEQTPQKPMLPGRRQYRYSAPDLVTDPRELSELQDIGRKHPLTKSLSDTPPSRISNDGQSAASRFEHREESRISQVTDYLCLGNLEAAYSERLLCKNKITSILDLSNIDPDNIPSSRKNIAPCTCSSPQQHMRAVLRLTMCESDLVEVKSHFDKINKFIEGTRSNKKKVLVFCDSSNNNLSVLIIAQYLMQIRNMDFRKAFSQIMKSHSDIKLNPAYSALLQSLENQLFYLNDLPVQMSTVTTKEKRSLRMRRQSSDFLPKEAWSGSGSGDL